MVYKLFNFISITQNNITYDVSKYPHSLNMDHLKNHLHPKKVYIPHYYLYWNIVSYLENWNNYRNLPTKIDWEHREWRISLDYW